MNRAALFLALLCLGSVAAGAQSPLERRVTLHVRDVALRDALDRIAALADIRLSYSGDNLPLDRRVSVASDTSAVAQVLGELFGAYPVDPVVVGSDHIVLTPRSGSVGDAPTRDVAVLDRIVVTGNVVAAPTRELPIALDVVPGRDIERRDEGALSKIFSGAVPGVWLWEHTPTSMLARYGSIRGSSSFGLSFPKVYIDGIEVANPLLLTQISPELVERVEVIRGPQGAALYGSDAISGVVNIVSRHEGVAPDGAHAQVRSSIGYSASAFTNNPVGVQEHAVTLRTGSNLRSAGIMLGGSTSGQFIPQAYSRELRGVADARVIGARSTLTSNARFYTKTAGIPVSPLLASLDPDEIGSDSEPQRLRMYSLGSTLALTPDDRWMYAVTAGVDGYTLTNVSIEQSAIPSVADSALRNASGSAARGTLRGSAVGRIGAPERIGATLTFALEQSVLRDRTLADLRESNSGPGSERENAVHWTNSMGLSAQTTVALKEALFVTAGIRRERLGQPRALSQVATLPMIGASLVRGNDMVSWKLRAAYGKGVRAPSSSINATRQPRRLLPNPNLDPETQAGVEAGGDLFLGRRLGLHVTRFDQLATGLIQTVNIIDPSSSGPGRSLPWYQLQNVGEISNRGWETQATLHAGKASLAGAATFVDSRVGKLASGYTGDLRPGDRMLAVPARTLSGTASWEQRRFQVSASLSRASDWINYDRLGIATALINAEGDSSELTGGKLRQFWISYPGATRLRGALSFDAWRGTLMTVTGENLLNHQRGEPDTITIVPGRTIIVGVRARF
jgi:outer membrane receptor protein involved in Fe transport